MHGPRLSSGSQSRRRRRKTVTWDENCDVVEISADEHESDSDEKEEQGINDDHEEEHENDSFFRGDCFQNEERITDEHSYENSDSHNASSDDDPSLGLDPDASISGLVEKMFASSSGKTINASLQNIVDTPSSDGTTSTPSPQAIGSQFPIDLNTDDRIPPGRSHCATQFLRNQGECSRSPKPSPPHFSDHFSLQQVGDGQVLNLPAQASHGPPVTPPRQSSLVPSPGAQTSRPFDAAGEVAASSSSYSVGSPAASENVYSSHVVTPTLSRSTYAERHQLAQKDCEDIHMLPEFEVSLGPSSILSEDPLSLSTLILPIDTTRPSTESTDHHNVLAKFTSSVSEDAQLKEDRPVLAFEGCSHLESSPDISQRRLKSPDSPSFDDHSENHHEQQRSKLPDANHSRPHTPDITSSKEDDEDVLAEEDMSALTNTSIETAIIEHAERRIVAGTPVMEGQTFGPVEAAQELESDVGSNIERKLDLGDIGSDAITASIDSHGTSEEEMPSVQSGGRIRMGVMGDVNLAMDMRSALDRLMDDVAGTQADGSVMTEDKDLLDFYQPAGSSSLNSRIMERAATESALLHNNGFVSRNFSASSDLPIASPPPPKNNIRSREQMILEKRREARRLEYEDFTPPRADRDEQRLLGIGRPSRRRSMSMGDADILGVDAEKRADTLLDVIGVGDIDGRDGELGDSIEKELKKMVATPTRKKTRYHIREREGTIYASSSDSNIISHMVGPGDVNVGRAWRPVRRPSDMNEYSKQIKEYRAQEKSGKAYGKVFVKVLGVKNIDIPLPRQPTFLTCTLNNGIHFVSTPECQLGRDFRIEQEFELIEHNKLEFTLTLKVRRDSHIIAQFHELTPPPPPVVAPPVTQNSSKGGMRSFFSSSPKKPAKDKLPVQNLPLPPQSAHRLPENLARYLKPDGTMARAFISFKDIASRCDTRLFETSYPLIGQRAEVGGKFSTLQAGEIILQIFRLPALPGIAPEQLPQSLEECHRGLRHINWHKVTYFEGILTQSGGDCSTWRRRQLRVIGANLVAFNDVTKKATAAIDLKKAIAVEDNQEIRKNALSPGGASHYDEDDGLYGVERSFRLVFPQGEEILFFADTDDEKARWCIIQFISSCCRS
ncbi:hypothetical protein C0993_003491 [Termitomyces sp. T159_Od127]|nr:hypothetical protein C0993_003491 [Termitomyces sp. T159_Od127]